MTIDFDILDDRALQSDGEIVDYARLILSNHLNEIPESRFERFITSLSDIRPDLLAAAINTDNS